MLMAHAGIGIVGVLNFTFSINRSTHANSAIVYELTGRTHLIREAHATIDPCCYSCSALYPFRGRDGSARTPVLPSP